MIINLYDFDLRVVCGNGSKGYVMKIPKHIAVIMDGNGRWAKSKGLPRLAGHKAGVETLRDILDTAGNMGVKNMTFYAFSTENWSRPKSEVSGLMKLLSSYLKSETKRIHENGIRLRTIGDISKLPEQAQKELHKTMELTKNNKEMTVYFAFNYGGRQEIIKAVKDIATDVKSGKLSSEDIGEEIFSNYLYTADVPDPELMIRTSGELRISNFLLWQMAYTEYYFTDCYWPDFNGEELKKAIEHYNMRDRRFGNVKG